jgi:hypothetical protein
MPENAAYVLARWARKGDRPPQKGQKSGRSRPIAANAGGEADRLGDTHHVEQTVTEERRRSPASQFVTEIIARMVMKPSEVPAMVWATV